MGRFDYTSEMRSKDVIRSLAALAQETRLNVYRRLVQAGSAGMTVGDIAVACGVPSTTLSFHIRELSQSGLIETSQAGRFTICRADFNSMAALMQFLTENCCGGLECEAPSPLSVTQAKKAVPAKRVVNRQKKVVTVA